MIQAQEGAKKDPEKRSGRRNRLCRHTSVRMAVSDRKRNGSNSAIRTTLGFPTSERINAGLPLTTIALPAINPYPP